MKCQHSGDNHSSDTITAYYGQATPLTICGYHARYNLEETIREARAK